MGVGGYAPTEDLAYTTLEIAASVAALHVACRYDLRVGICADRPPPTQTSVVDEVS